MAVRYLIGIAMQQKSCTWMNSRCRKMMCALRMLIECLSAFNIFLNGEIVLRQAAAYDVFTISLLAAHDTCI